MKEPRRLLDDPGTSEVEMALLRAGRLDAPAAGESGRTLVALTAALGAPAAHLPGVASVAAGARVAGHLPWAKIAVVALAALGTGALVSSGLGHRAAPSEAVSPPAGPGPSRQESEVAASSLPLAAAAVAEPAQREATASEPPERRAPRRQPGRRAAEPVPGGRPDVSEQSLSAELQALDGARAAIESHDPYGALRALAEYDGRFPRGRLGPEAALLRLTALVRAHRLEAAKALGKKLLASQSSGAYGQRIRSLIEEAERE